MPGHAFYSPALKVDHLVEDELVLIVGRQHRLAKKSAATVKEIERERLVLFEPGSSIRRATDQFFDSGSIRPALALESNDTYFIKLVSQGRATVKCSESLFSLSGSDSYSRGGLF